MKLLLDQGLPRSAAALLRKTGIDTVHVGKMGLATAEDAASRKDLEAGVVVSVQPGRGRLRRLPLSVLRAGTRPAPTSFIVFGGPLISCFKRPGKKWEH